MSYNAFCVTQKCTNNKNSEQFLSESKTNFLVNCSLTFYKPICEHYSIDLLMKYTLCLTCYKTTRLSDLVGIRIGGVALDASNILNVFKGSVHKSSFTSMITFIKK